MYELHFVKLHTRLLVGETLHGKLKRLREPAYLISFTLRQ